MGKTNLSKKDNPVYMGLQSPMPRVGDEKEKEKKERDSELEKNGKKKTKIRKVEMDCLWWSLCKFMEK